MGAGHTSDRGSVTLGMGFNVVSEEGRIGEALYHTWYPIDPEKTAGNSTTPPRDYSWTEKNTKIFAEKIGERRKIEGLQVFVYDDGTTNQTVETVVQNNRSNNHFLSCSIYGQSFNKIAQCVNDGSVTNTIHEGWVVIGCGRNDTNYGFNSGLCTKTQYLNCFVTNTRRSIDGHKSAGGLIQGGTLGDGFGGHFVWDYSLDGVAISAGHGSNPAAVQVAGGGALTLKNCPIALHAIPHVNPAATNALCAVNIRGDGMEWDGVITVEDCPVRVAGNVVNAPPSLFTLRGPDGSYDTLRKLSWPRKVTFRNCPVSVVNNDVSFNLLALGKTFEVAGFPEKLETNSVFEFDNCMVRYFNPATGEPGPGKTGNNEPRTQIFVSSSVQYEGTPYIVVKGYQHLKVWTIASETARNKSSRPDFLLLDGTGDTLVEWSSGAVREVVYQTTGNFTQRRASTNSAGAALGDERFTSIGQQRRPVYMNTGTQAGFVLDNGTPMRFDDTQNMVNFAVCRGAAAGDNISFQAAGASGAIGYDFVSKGTGSHRFLTAGTAAQQFEIRHSADATTYAFATGGVGRGSLGLQSADQNADFQIDAKGTGRLLTRAIGLSGSGSTGDVSTMSVTVNGNAEALKDLLASIFEPWTAYSPTFNSAGGTGVTFPASTARYRRVGKTLDVRVALQVAYTTSPTTITCTLPDSVVCKGDGFGPAWNKGRSLILTCHAQNNDNKVYIGNGGSAIGSASGQWIIFKIQVEIP